MSGGKQRDKWRRAKQEGTTGGRTKKGRKRVNEDTAKDRRRQRGRSPMTECFTERPDRELRP